MPRGRGRFTNFAGMCGSDDESWRILARLRGIGLGFLPFAPDSGEAECAELELVAEPTEDRGLVPFLERAGQIIRPLALDLEVDQLIGRTPRLQLGQRLRKNASQE